MPVDHAETFTQCRDAAQRGDPSAQFKLGVMYGLGLGVAQDYRQAVHWYEEAAGAGDARAQNNLGWMYGTGRGVPQDFIKAYAWYNVAAASGDDVARRNRDALAERMAASQLESAQQVAGEIFERCRRAD